MPLQLRSHCRRSPLGAAAFLQLWGAGCCAWCCGTLGAVVHLRSDALGTAAHLAQRRIWHSGTLGTAARLAQRRAWCCGAYGKIRQFPPTAPNRPPLSCIWVCLTPL